MSKNADPAGRAGSAGVKRPTRALQPVPPFASEAEERNFWETHDSTGHVDWSRVQAVRLPKLKPTSRSKQARA